VRINIPFASYADESGKYARSLATICKERAKDGIEVNVTHDFMEKNDLIRWCGQNTLNCFLYDRNQPGLAATTDQAITSGRPLITSKNNTFRHIQSFIKPFPFQSLKEAIENTEPIVEQIQKEWSPTKFRERFESVLNTFDFKTSTQTNETVELKIFPPWEQLSGIFQTVKENVAIRTRLKNLREHRTLSRRVLKPQKVYKVTSYSQFGEDIVVRELFDEIPVKYMTYLDIGANNPKFISNTYSFYESGFTGVLVEPNPYLVGKLRHVRPNDTVVNAGIGIDESVPEADFYMFAEDADGLSTFSPEEAKHWESVGLDGKKHKIERIWKMPLININKVIDEYFTECPDFVSIDVEGWDLQILKTFDFNKYCPSVFCVETLAYKKDGSTYRISEIYDFFEAKGYFSLAETYANNIFVNKNLYDFYQYQKARRKT
jgi:FkbM family methyltransferase